jgi:hypothetical protein
MAGLTEFYCRSNETSHGSQFKWLDNTFKRLQIRALIIITFSRGSLGFLWYSIIDQDKENFVSKFIKLHRNEHNKNNNNKDNNNN